ncbi:protein PHOTOSYSTEM I ASSEMBLY 2, chloroplastic [Heracleum sosnowskyi]|uniref:Protein PHOTOSYSTEM I ASSEMBLY 2, chloroplastic n=1 Tax=Heracleum sosnowskyi TaxID=360622 RepID=A0AAD8HR05_9APIA|nr:protein PHOTOSYSTEM I ASSEMBLY 2, chloroplastic [Heracleum sosnowskyi]
MANFSVCWSSMVAFPAPPDHNCNHHLINFTTSEVREQVEGRKRSVAVSATKSGGFASIGKGCSTCKGKGGIECPGCKGTGRNKKNGNIFERWKCYDCQGFGMKGCPSCGKGGLTPEQRGER